MIHLGVSTESKSGIIERYCAENAIEKVVILTPEKFRFGCHIETKEYVEYDEIILYKFFYRLLSEINNKTLVVVNECMRTQNRNDLTYNCIRHYLNQTNHQLIFQYLPIIENMEDFMILFDFDTKSQWKREKFSRDLLSHCQISINPVNIQFRKLSIPTNVSTQKKYEAEKEKIFAEIGLKDPHTLPRNLYLIGGRDKLSAVKPDCRYIGRNNRFKCANMQTYKEENYPNRPYFIFEFCHNFIDFGDVVSLSGQSEFEVLVSDLKVDEWYFNRFTNWTQTLKDGYAGLH